MKKVVTIPNILSFVRILLIPIFIVFYFDKSLENNMVWAAVILLISGATDVLDGIIARSFNMISSFGKFIDPAADKLTQGAVVVCLSVNHPVIVPLLVLFFAKEFTMLLASIQLFKIGLRPSESKWWGKMATVVFYLIMLVILVADAMEWQLAMEFIITMVVIASISILFSLFNYYPIFKDIQTGKYDMEAEKKIKTPQKK